MEFKSETIITKADELVDLVAEAKEISFEEASKKLGVPVLTIEAWASFLEEEGLLSVRYKLTTPFLTSISQKKEGLPERVESPAESISQEKLASVNKAYDALAKGDLSSAERDYNALKSYYETIPTGQQELKQLIEHALVKLNKDISVKRSQVVQLSITDGSSKMVRLIKDSMNFLRQDDIEKAEMAYADAKDAFENLPSGFDREKRRLENSMVRLFKEISARRGQLLSKKFVILSQEIQKALPYFKQYVAEEKLDEAVNVYEQIKTVYRAIPNEFADEKMKLQEQILIIYNELAAKSRKKLLSEMQQKSAEISALLDSTLKKLQSGSIESAKNDYEKIREAYDSLPNGFLREKTALQNRIVRAYEEMASRSERVREKSYEEEKGRVNKLVSIAEQQLHNKRLIPARKAYDEALLVFSSMPESKEKSALHYKLASLRNRFIEERAFEEPQKEAEQKAAKSNAEKAETPTEQEPADGNKLDEVKFKIMALKSAAAPSVKQPGREK